MENKPRTATLFHRLNKLTNINYPNLHNKGTSKLFNLNDFDLENKEKHEKPPQNVYKINYTVIQNELSPMRKKNLSKFAKFFAAHPNPLPHKNSLWSPIQRKISEKKKRSFSDNSRFSFSNIIDQPQASSLAAYKINNFKTPHPHSNYFEGDPSSFVSLTQETPTIFDNILKNTLINQTGSLEVIKLRESKGMENKNKTNSLGSRKINKFKKTFVDLGSIKNSNNISNKQLLSVEPIIRGPKRPNISLDIDCLQDEYDFGVKKVKSNDYRQSIYIDNDTESLKKIKSSAGTYNQNDDTPVEKKNYPKSILVIKDVGSIKKDFLENNKNDNENADNSSQPMQEEVSSSDSSSIKPSDSERVSILKQKKILRKKEKLMTKVKFNDYQNQANPKKVEEANISKCQKYITLVREYLIKMLKYLNCKNQIEFIKVQIDKGMIDVLIASSENREIELSYRKTKRIILPGSNIRKFWDAFIMVLIFYQLIKIPLMIGFSMQEDLETFLISELFVVIAFLFDIFLNFRTGYINSRGILELYPSKIYKHYRRRYFLLDFISSIPINDFGTNLHFLYLLRLLRISRLLRIIARFTEYINYHPAILRIIKSIMLLLFLWHWIACFYWYICSYEGVSANPWGIQNELLSPSAEFSSIYLNSLFFAVTVTTGVGANLNPNTDLETGYTIFSIVIGVFMYGLILGAASGGLSSLDEGDSELRKQMEALNGFLRKRKVSLDIQKRIQENLKYVWSSHQSFNVNSHWFLKGVHQLLQLELTIEINRKYLEKVPMFKHISFDCMIFLISILESRIYLPEEFVVYEQQEGKEMFFIQSGLLEVIDQTKNLRIRLIEGDFFGEQALLNDVKRNASVKSVIYSELLILTREGLKKTILMHPDFALKLFTYLKKKIWNQLRSRGEITAKFKWSFLILMVKTAINICKLSDHSLNVDRFLTNSPPTTYIASNISSSGTNNIIKLQRVGTNLDTPKKQSNIYSGIRELSEFVMTKTKQATEGKDTQIENKDIDNTKSQENLFQLNKKNSNEKYDMGNMTPQQALKFKFTITKPKTLHSESNRSIISKEENK